MSDATPLDPFACPLDGITLVEASAGTGKTWTLTALYLRLLLERRLEVQQILVVTFTKAATAELRERIRSRIVLTLDALRAGRAALAADDFAARLVAALQRQEAVADEEVAARLDRALQTFDEAAIFTIHGFCQRALADVPFVSGMPLALELLADDTELRLEAVHDFWRRHVAGGALSPALASRLLAGKDAPERWAGLLKRHLAKPLARMVWPAGVEGDRLAPGGRAGDGGNHAGEGGDTTTAALDTAFAAARARWQREREAIVALLVAALPRLHGGSYKPETIATTTAQWDERCAAPDALAWSVKEDKTDRFGSQMLGLKAKKGQTPPAHPFFDEAQALLDAREHTLADLDVQRLRLLRRLLDEAPRALRAAKRERRVVAFDDMLFNLHERLTGGACPQLAPALRARFPAALVDEFQDTDPLQFEIFRSLYGNADADAADASLVLVGDPKQAIYSFRNADLHTYLKARPLARAVHTLEANQRSTPQLLAALNALFGANSRAFVLEGLDYRAVSAGAKPRLPLVDRSEGGVADGQAGATRETRDAGAALRLWRLPPAEDGQPILKSEARRLATEASAAEIARLVAEGQRGRITHGGRPLAAGDIAVLVRSHSQGALMRLALGALGVGSVELSQAGLFDSADAEALERVLAAVLQPSREPLVRAALATEWLGFDAAAIEALAADEAAMLAQVTRFAADRDTWRTRGIGVMLRGWMLREGVAARLLARADGERRVTNLLHLVETMQQAAETHPSPPALLRWLQAERREASDDEARQLRLESDRNLVQIVTIHRSKGLEYPIVFCPYLWDGYDFRPNDGLDGLQYHDAHGEPVIDFAAARDDEGLKARGALERSAETARLTYVALTRAVHRCVVVVGVYGTKTSGPKPSAKEAMASMLNWFVAGDGHERAAWTKAISEAKAPDPTPINDAWTTFARRASPDAALVPLPDAPGRPVAPQHPPPETLAALDPPARLPGAWRIGSYSSLTHGAQHEAAALDHDQRPELPGGDVDAPPDEAATASETWGAAADVPGAAGLPDAAPARTGGGATPAVFTPAPDDILNFPRGAAAGECLHAVFERADFGDAQTWPAAIETALRRAPPLAQGRATGAAGLDAGAVAAALHGLSATPSASVTDASALSTSLPSAAATTLHARQLARALGDVLHTPLEPGLQLAAVPRQRRLAELEFTLPAAALRADALVATLRTHGLAVPALAFTRLAGYLRGFIDLVFEHEGRYHLLDWKSNHLGATPADYAAAPVARAVAAHGYQLQALLYTVALHRHLRQRIDGYRYDTHFGSAWVLFVRGVRPGWLDAEGRPCGVHRLRPSAAAVEALSALFDAAAAGRPAEVAR